jgi:hypothetical protein
MTTTSGHEAETVSQELRCQYVERDGAVWQEVLSEDAKEEARRAMRETALCNGLLRLAAGPGGPAAVEEAHRLLAALEEVADARADARVEALFRQVGRFLLGCGQDEVWRALYVRHTDSRTDAVAVPGVADEYTPGAELRFLEREGRR